MNIKIALSKAESILKNSSVSTPALDAGVILCFVLGCEYAYILTHQAHELSLDEESKYFSLINLRAAGDPIQYLTGNKEFMSLNFKVNPSVLIPRPETEVLVEIILDYLKCNMHEKKLHILDMGTGSGCIAVSLAYYLKNCSVIASDISALALGVAYINAVKNKVEKKINFVQSNLFENLGNMRFDVIVSNPPYVPTEEISKLQNEIKKHEPLIALDGGEDGLKYYRRIIEEAPNHIARNGLLGFEVGFDQSSRVACLMEQRGFEEVKAFKDLSGIYRVVIGKYRI